jgi:hypothetical protein
MKIVEYKTATGTTPDQLDKEVNELLDQGYQIYGDPYSTGELLVSQAMVLDKKTRIKRTKAIYEIKARRKEKR